MKTETRALLDKAQQSVHAARNLKLDSRFHRYILDAQDTRNIGDYGIGPGVSVQQVEEIISRAEEFIQVAEALLA